MSAMRKDPGPFTTFISYLSTNLFIGQTPYNCHVNYKMYVQEKCCGYKNTCEGIITQKWEGTRNAIEHEKSWHCLKKWHRVCFISAWSRQFDMHGTRRKAIHKSQQIQFIWRHVSSQQHTTLVWKFTALQGSHSRKYKGNQAALSNWIAPPYRI